jgi:hypothetical protein
MALDGPKPLGLAVPIAAAANAAATAAFFPAVGIVAAAPTFFAVVAAPLLDVPFFFSVVVIVFLDVPVFLAIVVVAFAGPVFLAVVIVTFLAVPVFLAVTVPQHMTTTAAQTVPDCFIAAECVAFAVLFGWPMRIFIVHECHPPNHIYIH